MKLDRLLGCIGCKQPLLTCGATIILKYCSADRRRDMESTMSLPLKVECYSGYKADERPLRFKLEAQGARTFEVREVLDQWYGPEYVCFKVRADDGNLYILRHTASEDVWTLDSFRRD